MAAMIAKGPVVSSNDEAEMLACRKAIEFKVYLVHVTTQSKM